MAVRGRKPKPTGLKLITGNPGRRELPESEEDFTPGDLVLPSWLDEKERTYRTDFVEEWDRIVSQLQDWGIIGKVNAGAVEGICVLFANFRRAVRNSESAEARQTIDGYRKALNEFGLTPASKARVATGKGKKPQSKAASYFGA